MTQTHSRGLPVQAGHAGRCVHLDPRTKLILIAAMATAVALAPSLAYEMLLMALAFGFGVMLGRPKASAVMLVLYAAAVAATQLVPYLDSVALRTAFGSFFLLMRKVFACALMAYATVTTTHVNALMSSLARVRAPRQLSIPLAVAMRYAPAVSEDWSFIRDAMRMRGISPSPMSLLKAPARTVDCVYAPLLMSASRVCDDLSMAAIVRGIENPAERTCYLPIAMRPVDYAMLALGLCAVAGAPICGAIG